MIYLNAGRVPTFNCLHNSPSAIMAVPSSVPKTSELFQKYEKQHETESQVFKEYSTTKVLCDLFYFL